MHSQNTNQTPADSLIIETSEHTRRSIIWLHGLGADCRDFEPLVPRLACEDTRFIFPNAPVRPISVNANLPFRAWYDVYSLSDLDVEDEAGIRASQQFLTDLIDAEIARGRRPEEVLVAGFSQGGAVALFTALRYPQPLGGVIALSTYLPLRAAFPEERLDANRETPIFLAHGTQDPVLPYQLAQITRDILLDHQHAVDWHTYPMQHEICPEEIQDLKNWLKRETIA